MLDKETEKERRELDEIVERKRIEQDVEMIQHRVNVIIQDTNKYKHLKKT